MRLSFSATEHDDSRYVFHQASARLFKRPNSHRPVYKDPNASTEARIADLLPRMTLEER